MFKIIFLIGWLSFFIFIFVDIVWWGGIFIFLFFKVIKFVSGIFNDELSGLLKLLYIINLLSFVDVFVRVNMMDNFLFVLFFMFKIIVEDCFGVRIKL